MTFRSESTAREERVCIALDFPSRSEILAMARLVAGRVGWLKVGLEAFVAEGPALIAEVAAAGPRVFLDLKLHDIPATVAGAVAAAARSGAEMVNVHASGGRAMLEAAREAADRAGLPRLVAVTLLTSLDAKALADLPMAGYPEGIARRLAILAVSTASSAPRPTSPGSATRAVRTFSPSCRASALPARDCRTRSARRRPRPPCATGRGCWSSAGR
jgi:orotidine-5'-phosphate decarboxylase